jgi:hypothetical protein
MVHKSSRSADPTGTPGRYVTTINGIGLMAFNWMRSLKALTLRTDLPALSMVRWSEVLSPIRLFHDTPLWCPDCYNECRAAGNQVYEPLVWALRPVLGCIRHRRALVSRCDHCSRTRRHSWTSVPLGHCSHCGRWLGDERERLRAKRAELYEKVSQDWILHNLGELLASNIQPSRRRLTEALKFLANRHTNGNRCQFARIYADSSKSTAHQWWMDRPIAVDALLTISYRTQRSIISLLTAEFDASYKQLELQLIQKVRQSKRRRRSRKLDKSTLESSLYLVLQEEHPPCSFPKVADRLEVDPRRLRKMFPELSRAVAAHCKKERESLKAKRLQAGCQDIQWAANQVIMRGIYPSRRRVVNFLKAHGKVPFHNMLGEVLNRTR